MSLGYYKERTSDAIAKLTAMLALPDIPDDGMCSDGECFEPWDMFPCLYGSYSSAFDELAIDVLTDILDGTHKRDDLANEMFREMLCTAGMCEYGSSPRVCFAEQEFLPLLPRLIERWRKYSEIMWK